MRALTLCVSTHSFVSVLFCTEHISQSEFSFFFQGVVKSGVLSDLD